MTEAELDEIRSRAGFHYPTQADGVDDASFAYRDRAALLGEVDRLRAEVEQRDAALVDILNEDGRALREAGAAEERARVVDWLRRSRDWRTASDREAETLALAGDRLEVGELMLPDLLPPQEARTPWRTPPMPDTVTATEYRALVRAGWSEEEFLRAVVALAGSLGWLTYHVRDSRRCAAGYPDLAFVADPARRTPGYLLAELKVKRNGPTAAQKKWLASLRAAGVRAYLWYPRDWDEIVEALR